MRRIRSGLVLLSVFTALALVPIEAAIANDISNFTTVTGTDVVHAGFGGMRNDGTGTLTVSGIPELSTIESAYLYWHGPTNSENPAANSAVTFAGSPATGTNIGISHDNNWGFANSQAYRADVTSLVSGNGTYSLTGFVKDDGATNVNGASLIVFFDDSNAENDRDVVLFDGNDSNISNEFDFDGWNVTLSGINYESGSAFITMHVSDGQTFEDDALILNGSELVGAGPIFQGDSVQGGTFNENGQLWDIKTENVTSALEPGPNTLTLTTGVNADALSLVVAAIDLPAGAAPPTTHTLTVNVTGDGGGTVTDGEGGQIVCTGSGDPEFDDCVGEYEEGATVELFAIPDETSTFAGWDGCDAPEGNFCSVTMNDERTVSAQFDPVLAPDLSIVKTDAPDPVTAATALRYTLNVANSGTTDATNVQVVDQLPSGTTYTAAAGAGWTCTPGTGTVTCTRPVIAATSSAPPINIDVTAPATAGTINNVADVSSTESDTAPANNHDEEPTTVLAANAPDQDATFCKSGCTLSTDTGNGATPADPTVTFERVPSNANAQAVSIVERPSSDFPGFCGGTNCTGQVVTLSDVSGVTNNRNPIIVVLTFDKTVGGTTQLYIKKDAAPATLIPKCTKFYIASPHPCVSTTFKLPNGDRVFVVLMLSGDPILGKK